MILLWGLPEDPALASISAGLESLDARTLLFDQRLALVTSLDLEVGASVVGELVVGGTPVDLGSITAVYLRPYDVLRLIGGERPGSSELEQQHALACSDALWTWADLTPALVVNRPRAMGRTSSKPYQATMLREAGFEVPDTLVTTSPEAALEFRRRHGTIVYKSASSVRSIVTSFCDSDVDRLLLVTFCPTQFQEYVPGIDYRVHVVGEEVFATRIFSDACDYRYGGRQDGPTSLEHVDIDEGCASRCVTLTRTLGLSFAGIDLRRTPDGRWYCFEANSCPGFTYFDRQPEHPMATAIARLLWTAGR